MQWVYFTWVFRAGYVLLHKLLLWLDVACWEKGNQDPRLNFRLSDVARLSLGTHNRLFVRVFLTLLICRCPEQVNETPLAGRVAWARAFSLTRSCQFSSFSISTFQSLWLRRASSPEGRTAVNVRESCGESWRHQVGQHAGCKRSECMVWWPPQLSVGVKMETRGAQCRLVFEHPGPHMYLKGIT